MEAKPIGHGANDRRNTQTHHNYVVPDPVAFAYLEEDPSTEVVSRIQVLKGYECYCVEQWVCSRTDPTFIITTYTGDPSRYIVSGILSVPIDKSTWSARLRLYFGALEKYHARKRETGVGIIMITNLGAFPSSLTLIQVPNGSVREHREDFYVNENLKRMGCSGRIGLTLSKPSPASAAKFYQLYRVSQKISLNTAVLELVKLCQIALMIFGKLDEEYTDGLLCDITEKALSDWWIEFGTEYYSVEPHDGILGPTTVAALLGMLIGARNRLHASGAPISKDVFEVDSTKRAIAYFQKTHKMSKTRRLDRQTLDRLHRSTSKLASGEGWFVPRTVKSTLSEFTGKGGEMVTHMIGSKDKAIAEVETIEIDRFAQNVYGARAKWMWLGKSRKLTFNEESGATLNLENIQRRESLSPVPATEKQQETEERERNRLKKQTERQQSIKASDSSRALGRIKDAVGLRSTQNHHHHHHRRHSKSSKHNLEKLDTNLAPALTDPTPFSLNQESVVDNEAFFSPSSTTDKYSGTKLEQLEEIPTLDKIEYQEHIEPPSDGEEFLDVEPEVNGKTLSRSESSSPEPLVSGSVYRGVDLDGFFDSNNALSSLFSPQFRRSQSYAPTEALFESPGKRPRYPRNLSFSEVEEGLSTWSNILEAFQSRDEDSSAANYEYERSLRIRNALQKLDSNLLAWVQEEIEKANHLSAALAHDADELGATCDAREEEVRELALESKEMVTQEREQLEEVIKDIEILGSRLDYETKMLKGKVEDVEGGVGEFEMQVLMVEERVAQLEKSMEPKESWAHWLMRILTGIGYEQPVGAK